MYLLVPPGRLSTDVGDVGRTEFVMSKPIESFPEGDLLPLRSIPRCRRDLWARLSLSLSNLSKKYQELNNNDVMWRTEHV